MTEPTREALIAALTFYASRRHFGIADGSAWDTVSGEPQNFWCDDAGTATIEDGTIAALVLSGEMTAEHFSEDAPRLPPKLATELDLRLMLAEERETNWQLCRALREATDGATFMGEPVLSATPPTTDPA